MGQLQVERQFRIDLIKKEILNYFQSGVKQIDLKGFEASFCYRLGISKRSFKEYLDIALYLVNSEIQGDYIIYKNGKQKQLNE